MIYLDNAATTPILPAVLATFNKYASFFANPSSLHSFGFECRNVIEESRSQIATHLNAIPSEIYFTGGGTISNNIAILGTLSALRNKGKIITSPTEHPSVLEPIKNSGVPFELVNILPNGTIDLNHLESLLDNDTSLVSLMHVNNETGSINPINEIYNLVKSKSPALLHVDNVQGYGKIPHPIVGADNIRPQSALPTHPNVGVDAYIDPISAQSPHANNSQLSTFNSQLSADLVSLSSHKIGGFKSIGGLYIKKDTKIKPILHGGGQEKGLYSGTENLPLIASFATASQIAHSNIEQNYNKVKQLHTTTHELLSKIPDTHFTLHQNNCEFLIVNCELNSPYILSVRFDHVMGETLLHCLERHQIYISTGSACSSHNSKPSGTLTALGLTPKQIKETIRLSFSSQNTLDEIETACDVIANEVETLRKIKSV